MTSPAPNDTIAKLKPPRLSSWVTVTSNPMPRYQSTVRRTSGTWNIGTTFFCMICFLCGFQNHDEVPETTTQHCVGLAFILTRLNQQISSYLLAALGRLKT